MPDSAFRIALHCIESQDTLEKRNIFTSNLSDFASMFHSFDIMLSNDMT